MSELVECPECLGSGATLKFGKFPKICSLCKGDSEVTLELETLYINSIDVKYD